MEISRKILGLEELFGSLLDQISLSGFEIRNLINNHKGENIGSLSLASHLLNLDRILVENNDKLIQFRTKLIVNKSKLLANDYNRNVIKELILSTTANLELVSQIVGSQVPMSINLANMVNENLKFLVSSDTLAGN